MADIRINKDTGELALPDQSGGYRLYRKGEYKLDGTNNRVAIPDGRGFVMFDLPPPARPAFNLKEAGRSFALGTRQTIEGLASPFTMVGDAANALTNLGISGVNAVAGTEIPHLMPMSAGVSSLLVNQAGFPTERNSQEQLLGAAIKGGSGALATMGTSAIPAVTKAAPTIASALRINPGSQTVGGLTGGAAAEGTRQGLQDTQLFQNETADTVAKGFLSLLAGVAGGAGGYTGARVTTNAAGAATGAAKGVTDLLTQGGRDRIAGQLLRQASGDPTSLPARLDDAVSYSSAIPGIRPTTAQALGGDTQLSSLELGLRNDPAYRFAFDARAADNQTARTAALDSLSPQGAGSVDDLAGAVKQAWNEADEAGRQEIIAAQNRAADLIAEMGGNTDQQTAGRIIREELQAAHGTARGQTGAAYRAIDPAGTSTFAGGEIWQRVAPTIETYFANSTTGTPAELLPIVTRLRESNSLSFPAVSAIRRELQDIAAKASRAGDRTLATAAGEMADGVAGYMDDAAASGRGFTPAQAEQYQRARDLRRDQGQKFERGAVGQVLKRGPFGEMRTQDSAVPAELFFRGGGSPEAAQQFISAAGSRQRAVQTLQDHIGTQLRQSITRPDGTIDAGKLMRFQQDHAGALEQFPELRQRVANVAEAQAAVDQATLAQTARQADMRGSPLHQFTTKNPADAVASIIGSKNSEAAVGQVARQLRNNPASLAAFKRSVVEWINRQIETAGVQPVSGEPVQSFAKLKRVMDTKLETLRHVFSDDEMRTLRSVADQMAAEARVTGAKPMGSNTFANLASRYLVERGTNALAPMTGNQSALTPSLGWILRGADTQVRDSINRALLNPDDALRMVRSAAPLNIRDLPADLRTFGRGLTAQGLMQGGAEQQRGLMAPQRRREGLMRAAP